MIGMGCVMQEYPLYYDAVNEKGLGIAGLNFVGNATIMINRQMEKTISRNLN